MLFPFPQKCALLLSLAAMPLLLACQQDVESSQAFQDQATALTEVSEDLKATIRQVSTLDADIQQLRRQTESMDTGGVDAEALAALEQRLLRIEDVMRKTGQTVAGFDKRLGELESRQTQVVKQIDEVEKLASRASAPKARVVASAPAQESVPTATFTSTREETPRKAGTYHLVRESDTLETLAQRYGTQPREIRVANRLPAGRDLIAGQRLYIPLK